MKVAILGRGQWDWGKGDVVVIHIQTLSDDDHYFAQCEERDDEDEADEIAPETAMDLLTRRGVRLTTAGRAWMKEQRDLWAQYEMMQRRPNYERSELGTWRTNNE